MQLGDNGNVAETNFGAHNIMQCLLILDFVLLHKKNARKILLSSVEFRNVFKIKKLILEKQLLSVFFEN